MRRTGAIGLMVAAALLLAGCFLLPGKFASTLDVRRDGAFTFAYKGEIVLALPPGMTGHPALQVDDPASPCFGPVPGTAAIVPVTPPAPSAVPPAITPVYTLPKRPCTADERTKRSAEIAKANAFTQQRQKQEAAQIAQITGVDPTDEASMRAYAVALAKQAGWRTVSYRGGGVFEVDFVQSGRLDRDFVFPVFPRATFIVPFVVVRKRADGAVLVSAPGFTANPAEALARGFSAGGDGTSPKPPTGGPQGSFVVTTDLPPLTNNTEDGPTRDGDRTRLAWAVSAAVHKVPETLLPLDR